VSCPTGTFAVSGGYQVNNVASGQLVEVAQSFPVGGSTSSPPTGWQATNFVGGSGTLTTYVICSS
jgi:hypothetical protein